jgi:hypothetical protein
MWSVRRSYLSGVTFWLCEKINAKIALFIFRPQASAPAHSFVRARVLRAHIKSVAIPPNAAPFISKSLSFLLRTLPRRRFFAMSRFH